MAKHGKKPTDNLAADGLDGVRIGFLAEEDEFDRRALWRLASWGVGAVCAVTIGVFANQSYTHTRRDRTLAVDLARQSEQIQTVAKENRNELKRLSAAVDTLNADRDRLYARTTTLEQGLESATGSIARQTAAPAAALPPPVPPAVAAGEQKPLNAAKASEAAHPPPTAQPAPLGAANPAASAMATPTASSTTATAPATPDSPITTTEADATASIPTRPPPQTQSESKPEIAMLAAEAPALTTPEPTAPAVEVAVPRTEFGVDLGTANTINGLRTLWRRVTASHQTMLADLRPVIALRERKGTAATQLRLIAGPLDDAAAAAKICVAMAASHHTCETAVFDGQRLAVNVEPAPVTRPPQRHTAPRHAHRETPTVRPAHPSAPPAPTATR